jgi:Asp-tRNA(Asn)/Glu-tRNA(Gln) amidotransferase C subunit
MASQQVSLEVFRTIADLAGLGLSQHELEELKPLYDLYLEYIEQLHALDLGAEEIIVEFHPDWPQV